jgi:hypothetical protein
MRNLILLCLTAVFACGGGGSREAALAKTARYQGDKLAIFNVVKTTTASKYQVAMSDENTLTVQTVGKWFSPEGLMSTSGEQDIRNVPDKSINVKLTVKVLADGGQWIVDVQPQFTRIDKGSPMPQQLGPNDASLPGWAPGKVDQLALEIHQALAQYEVKAPGGNIPPPATTTPTTPAEPAAGSAAEPTPPPAS